MTDIQSSSLSRNFVVVQDNQPSSPFEGQLWRDTNTDTLKQWDGSSWISVQTSPDEKTITKNSSGSLQVSKPSTSIIQDWEQDKGEWTISSDNNVDSAIDIQGESFQRTTHSNENTSFKGSYGFKSSVDLYSDTSSGSRDEGTLRHKIEATVDVTDAGTVEVPYWSNIIKNNINGTYSYLDLKQKIVCGNSSVTNTSLNESDGTSSSAGSLTLDISSESGEKTITVELIVFFSSNSGNVDGAEAEQICDGIQIDYSKPNTVKPELAGN